jgi:hypothetical protein
MSLHFQESSMTALRLTCIAIALTAACATAHSQTPAAASAPAAKPTKAAATKPASSMDLQAPPLNHVIPRSELQYIMAPDDVEDSATEVRVKGAKQVVTVPGAPGNQLQAIPWALIHPTQAWRIFTPLESN